MTESVFYVSLLSILFILFLVILVVFGVPFTVLSGRSTPCGKLNPEHADVLLSSGQLR